MTRQVATVARLYTGALPSSAGTLYTATSGKKIITSINLHNTDSVTRTVELWLVPSGGSADGTNKILKQDLAAGQTYVFDRVMVLEINDFIRGVAGAASVISTHIFGTEITVV